VVTQPARPEELTLIGGRPVEAFNQHGDTAMIELRCQRVGPPSRAGGSTDTCFRVTVLNAPIEADDSAAGTNEAAAATSFCGEGPSLWEALVRARTILDERGWLLPIAASRRDRWCAHAQRHPDMCVVHPFDNFENSEGMLELAPADTVVTVPAQRKAYVQWAWSHVGTAWGEA
jgi:hypothetical protein